MYNSDWPGTHGALPASDSRRAVIKGMCHHAPLSVLTLDCIVSAYIYVGQAFEVRLENGHISERLHRREEGVRGK